MDSAAKQLDRSDFRQEQDPGTGDVLLHFERDDVERSGHIEGYPATVVRVIRPDDVPLPPDVEQRRDEVDLESHEVVAAYRRAVIQAVISQTVWDAPTLLAEFVAAPMCWSDADALECHADYRDALSSVQARLRELRESLGLEHDEAQSDEAQSEQTRPETAPDAEATSVSETDNGRDDAEAMEVTRKAIEQVRASKTPQKLPRGAKTRLRKLKPGAYVLVDKEPDGQPSLLEAMDKAERAAGVYGESWVVDWDGRKPVIVRKYLHGDIGYRVEDAIS